MKKKKGIVIAVIILLVLAAGGVAAYLLIDHKEKNSGELVYVESVANITNVGFYGENRYMGIVESQESVGIKKDSEKTVKEVFVKVGDEVKEGDPLFEYDTEELELKLKELELELTSINNSIATANQQIASLTAERDQSPSEYKMEYTSQIQSLQAQVNQYNYDASAKQLEIDRQKASMENITVYSSMNGIVKEINDDSADSDSDYDYNYSDSEEKAYISITALGDYRIKGTASELNVRSMSEGQSVIIRSRIDENVTWRGTISLIDLEHPAENENNYYYYYGSSGTTATNYPFYIKLDSTEDLILGQHVYVELDYGQADAKEGIWLDEFYIVQDGDSYYVWTEDSDGRIEKRKVEVGEYDDDLWQYEILSGLTTDDYIAYPEDRITEGMSTTHDYQDIIDYEAENGGYDENGMSDEYYEDDMGGYIIDEDGNIMDEDGNIIGGDEIQYDESIDYEGDEDVISDYEYDESGEDEAPLGEEVAE